MLNGKRNELKEYLQKNRIPTMIYYPIPLYKQEAFSNYVDDGYYLKNTDNYPYSIDFSSKKQVFYSIFSSKKE